jgi:Methyltransferase domain
VRMHQGIKRYVWEAMDIAGKVQPLFGDSAKFDYSPYHGRVDLFFIDGAHSYEYVRSDTLNAMKCSRPGSVIAWHDFGRAGVNGVARWLMEFSKQHQVYSVPGGSLAFCVLPSK